MNGTRKETDMRGKERAALRAGLRRVPCIVHKTDEETAALYAVTENLQRSRLNAFGRRKA